MILQSHENSSTCRNRAPVMWMSFAVLVYSTLPLAFVLVEAGDSPFLFGAGLRAGQCAGVLLCLAVAARMSQVPGPLLKMLWKGMRRPGFPWLRGDALLVAVSFLEYGLLIQAAKLVDMAVAAVLLETWPVIFVLLARSLFRRRKRFVAMGLGGWSAIGLGLAGVAAIAFARWGDAAPGTAIMAVVGSAFAVSAALALALSGFGFRWAAEIVDELRWPAGVRRADAELLCVMAVMAPGAAAASVLQGLGGVALGEPVNMGTLFIAVAIGVIPMTAAGLAWRKAIVMTDDLAINAMLYSVPLLSLLWLAGADALGPADPAWLAVGATALATANIVLGVRGMQRSEPRGRR